MLRKLLAVGVAAVAALAVLVAVQPSAGASTLAAAGRRLLFIGQSSTSAYTDFTSFAGAPAGGSVYYEVKSGTWVSQGQQDYATYLASQGKDVQVGISWKDNPPGWTSGTEDQKAALSRQVTEELGEGQFQSQFTTLINFINQYPTAKFFLRLDYEVSTYYHCTDSSCSSYKNAFAAIRNYINSKTHQANVLYVYHPVRGEFAQLYPGDSVVDWIGVSIFANELCMPIYDQTGYVYDGTPPANYDTSTDQCRNPYIGTDSYGNPAAIWQDWNYDGNVLGMMKFAQDHAKPMIISESGMMNYANHGSDTSGLQPVDGNTWVKRLFGLMNYSGPIPNLSGTYDLSNVIQAATYINLDFRYGWDGLEGGAFDFPVNSMWFADGRLSQYTDARAAFCQGLLDRNFSTTCSGSAPPATTPPTTPPTTAPPATGSRNAFSTIEAESDNSQSGTAIVAESGASGGKVLGSFDNGDWARYDGVAFAGRTPNQVTFRYASARPANQAVTLEFHAGSATGPIIAAPGLLGTGSIATYKQISFNVSNVPAGTTSITVVARANDTADVLNLDWFSFS